jgi:hypothetical protein
MDFFVEIFVFVLKLAFYGTAAHTDSQRGCIFSCGAIGMLATAIGLFVVAIAIQWFNPPVAVWSNALCCAGLGCGVLFVVLGLSAGLLKMIDERPA